MQYQRLILYYSGLYTGAYVISPLGFDASKASKNKEAYRKNYQKTSEFVEMLDIRGQMRGQIAIALRDGAFYGVKRSDKSSCFIQAIDPDICKITSICNGTFLYSVDMSQLGSKLEFYPDEFTKMFNEYQRTGQKWQEVPSEICWCLKGDESVVNYSLPPFAAVMPSLYSIASTEDLQETASEIQNYKLVAGEVPVDKDGQPLMDYDMYLKYYNHLEANLGDNVGLAISPFKLSAIDFDQANGVSSVDNISKSVANFWASAGTSGLLHGISNDTSGVTKLAIKNDETYILGIVKQFERVVNRMLKTQFASSNRFKITILPVTVFNEEEYTKRYKEAASFGLGKSYYAATIGIPQHDIASLNFLENEFIGFNDLTPMKSSFQTGSDDSQNEPGRPQTDDTNLQPAGEATRDGDTNANR